MEIDLIAAREEAGITQAEAAEAAGLGKAFYSTYEMRREIPCKYAYKIWKAYPKWPLPEDFFWYTSFSLQCNMRHRGMTQKEAAKALGLASQGIVSGILSQNIPMYELKDRFIEAFDPLVVPCVPDKYGNMNPITELTPAGNFMNRKKARKGANKGVNPIMVPADS